MYHHGPPVGRRAPPRLDDPVQRLLPGVLPADLGAGSLQHTSGIHDCGQEVTSRPKPDRLPVRLACSNTGYVFLGMLIRAVTAHSQGNEVRTR
jgi:CubicO group peptidase (beta-lactamase class C family)